MHPDLSQPGGDWRLEVKLRERLRLDRATSSGARYLGQIEWVVESKRIGHDVSVSHNGMTVFAYGSTEDGLRAADRAIRNALIADGRTAEIRAARWDEATSSWREFDPALPPGYEPPPVPPARTVTRTIDCGAGRLVASAYKNDVESYAQRHGIECDVVSINGRFRTRFQITLTGAEEPVRDALTYIRKLAKSSSRPDPGSIPYGGF